MCGLWVSASALTAEGAVDANKLEQQLLCVHMKEIEDSFNILIVSLRANGETPEKKTLVISLVSPTMLRFTSGQQVSSKT